MLPLGHLDRIQVSFDDHRLVANAGLLLPVTLAQHLSLREFVDSHVDLGDAPDRANTGDKIVTLVASVLAGGDCIDDADALRAGGTARFLDASGTPVKGGGQTTGLLPPRHRHQPLRLQPLRRHPPIPPNQPSVTPTPTTSLCILTGDTPPRSRPAGATTTAATSRQSRPSNAPPPQNPPPSQGTRT